MGDGVDLTAELGAPPNLAGELGPPQGIGMPSDAQFSPEIPAAMNLKPAVTNGVDQTDLATRAYNRLYFANDPTASANYLRMRGYQPPEGGFTGGTFRKGGMGEVGRTAMDLVMDTPRMAAMGLGGLAGGLLGLETGPGALATGALGAGAADAGASSVLSAMGSNFAGVEGSPGQAAVGGGVEGSVGQVLGVGAKAVMGKAVNLFRDAVSIPEGLAALKGLFGVSSSALGKDVAGSVGNTANSLGLTSEIDHVLTNPEVINLVKTAATTEGNALVKLGTDTSRAVNLTGQALNEGIKDEAGNIIEPGVAAKINALPNSGMPWNEFHEASNKFVNESLQDLRIAQPGVDLTTTATSVRNEIENNVLSFKDELTKDAEKLADGLKQKITFLNEGGKDETGMVHEGLKQLKERLAPLQSLKDEGIELVGPKLKEYQQLFPAVVELENTIKSASGDFLKAQAQAENPVIDFLTLNNRKTAVGKLSNWTREEGKPGLSSAWKQYYGKFSSFVSAHALASDQMLGTEFEALSKRYSVLSDFQKMIEKTVGDATVIKNVPGLAPDGVMDATAKGLQGIGYGVGKVLKPTAQGLGAVARDLSDTAPLSLNAMFRRAVRKLPDNMDPEQRFRGNFFTNLAGSVAEKSATPPVFGVPLARTIAPFLVSSAGAQEPDLTTLKNSMTLSTLIDNGIAPPDSRQSGFDISKVDPQMMQMVNAKVMEALAPLNDAIRFGGEDEVGAAYSQVMKQFPELFPAPKTGIKGEVTDSKGNVKLYDPMDRARYMGQIQVDSDMDWGEKAKVVSELNSTFTVRNPKKYK